MSIGDYIRRIRVQKGYSQQFIADALEISQSKFNRIENDQTDISINELFQISEILRVNYIELLESSTPNQSGKYKAENNKTELSKLCQEVKSLKSQLSEIRKFIYASKGGKYLLTNFSKVLNFGKVSAFQLTYSPQ
jgi:transcriptional regulator with XRE-family HTH domain